MSVDITVRAKVGDLALSKVSGLFRFDRIAAVDRRGHASRLDNGRDVSEEQLLILRAKDLLASVTAEHVAKASPQEFSSVKAARGWVKEYTTHE